MYIYTQRFNDDEDDMALTNATRQPSIGRMGPRVGDARIQFQELSSRVYEQSPRVTSESIVHKQPTIFLNLKLMTRGTWRTRDTYISGVDVTGETLLKYFNNPKGFPGVLLAILSDPE